MSGYKKKEFRTEGGWNFRFQRPFNDWEIDLVQNLSHLVSSKSLEPHSVDRLYWKKSQGWYF